MRSKYWSEPLLDAFAYRTLNKLEVSEFLRRVIQVKTENPFPKDALFKFGDTLKAEGFISGHSKSAHWVPADVTKKQAEVMLCRRYIATTGKAYDLYVLLIRDNNNRAIVILDIDLEHFPGITK